MERWTFLIIAGDGGAPTHIRIVLRTGDDELAWPKAQLALDGSEVGVDEVPHDYEAPEWKAVQILDGGMGGDGERRMQQVKDGLRTPVPRLTSMVHVSMYCWPPTPISARTVSEGLNAEPGHLGLHRNIGGSGGTSPSFLGDMGEQWFR